MKKKVIKIPIISGNATPYISNVLNSLEKDVHNVILFEGNKYFFHKEGTTHMRVEKGDKKKRDKSVVFAFKDIENLTVDGNGAEFVFCDRIFPFLMQNCRNIICKNFSIDFSFQRYAEGKVDYVDDYGFAVKINKTKFEYFVEDGYVKFPVGSEVLSSRYAKISLHDKTAHEVSYIFAGDSIADTKNLAAKCVFVDPEEIEGGLYFKYREGSVRPERMTAGNKLFLGNDNERINQLFYMQNSNDLLFQYITIYRGAGMGIWGDMCENVEVDHVNIMPKPGRGDTYSITADSLHFINCSGKLYIHDCILEKSIDDAVNIHGNYTTVQKVLTTDSVLVDVDYYLSYRGAVLWKPGDVLHVNDSITHDEIGYAVVKEVITDKEHDIIIIKFEEDISAWIKEGMFLENPDRMPEVIFERCKLLDCPHFRISSSKKTIIRNNDIRLIDNILVNDLLKYWQEAGAVSEMIIENNRFLSKGTSIIIKSTRKEGSNRMHEKIKIAHNVFVEEQDKAIKADRVRKLEIKENVFGAN